MGQRDATRGSEYKDQEIQKLKAATCRDQKIIKEWVPHLTSKRCPTWMSKSVTVNELEPDLKQLLSQSRVPRGAASEEKGR